MEIKISGIVSRQNGIVEFEVKYWDETKPAPQDVINVSVFLRTDETNIFILKTEALQKSQEIITHVAGIALGKGDELLNEYILMFESLKGGISGLEPPAWPFPPITHDPIPQHILDWREGDEITDEHREAISSTIIQTFNLSPDKAAKTREEHAGISDAHIATNLAVLIASETNMSLEAFKRTFPTISQSSSLAVQAFLARAKKEE